MKYIYSLFFIFLCYSVSGQFYFNAGYSLSNPRQEMGKNIKPLHSISTGILYEVPKFKRLQAGIDFSWGSYASTRKEQTFNFTDGTSTKTWVNYSSNVMQVSATGRFMLLQNKKVIPYVSGKAGYSKFYSTIYIEDPHDVDGCKPLDQRSLIKDGTMSVGYGGGIQFDWALFGRNRGERYIDISVNNVRGSKVDYINTKKLIDANDPPVPSGGKALNVKFINATTREIHEHQVAEVYSTPLRMLEVKVSAVFSLSPGK